MKLSNNIFWDRRKMASNYFPRWLSFSGLPNLKWHYSLLGFFSSDCVPIECFQLRPNGRLSFDAKMFEVLWSMLVLLPIPQALSILSSVLFAKFNMENKQQFVFPMNPYIPSISWAPLGREGKVCWTTRTFLGRRTITYTLPSSLFLYEPGI